MYKKILLLNILLTYFIIANQNIDKNKTLLIDNTNKIPLHQNKNSEENLSIEDVLNSNKEKKLQIEILENILKKQRIEIQKLKAKLKNKIINKEKTSSNKQDIVPNTFLLIEDANIYDSPDGNITGKLKKGTLFTSNKIHNNYLKITGLFKSYYWYHNDKNLWIRKNKVIIKNK